MASVEEPSPFYKSIEAVFRGWTALQLAVAQSFGGSHSKEKAVWLIEATEQWFKENRDIDSTELEDFLAEIMSAEFNSVVDDNSLAEVSTKICRYYQLVSEGRNSELEQKLSSLRKTADVASCERRYDSDEEDDEDMGVDQQNVMSQMNALELSQNSIAEASPAENGETGHQGAGADDPEEAAPEDDGWTVVKPKSSKNRR